MAPTRKTYYTLMTAVIIVSVGFITYNYWDLARMKKAAASAAPALEHSAPPQQTGAAAAADPVYKDLEARLRAIRAQHKQPGNQ